MITRSLPKTIPFSVAWIALSSTTNYLASPPLQNLNLALPINHLPVSFPSKIVCTTSPHFFLNLLLIILSSPLAISCGHPWPLFFNLFNLAVPGLSCGLWDLGPWPGIKRRPPALRATGPPGKSPHDLLIATLIGLLQDLLECRNRPVDIWHRVIVAFFPFPQVGCQNMWRG